MADASGLGSVLGGDPLAGGGSPLDFLGGGGMDASMGMGSMFGMDPFTAMSMGGYDPSFGASVSLADQPSAVAGLGTDGGGYGDNAGQAMAQASPQEMAQAANMPISATGQSDQLMSGIPADIGWNLGSTAPVAGPEGFQPDMNQEFNAVQSQGQLPSWLSGAQAQPTGANAQFGANPTPWLGQPTQSQQLDPTLTADQNVPLTGGATSGAPVASSVQPAPNAQVSTQAPQSGDTGSGSGTTGPDFPAPVAGGSRGGAAPATTGGGGQGGGGGAGNDPLSQIISQLIGGRGGQQGLPQVIATLLRQLMQGGGGMPGIPFGRGGMPFPMGHGGRFGGRFGGRGFGGRGMGPMERRIRQLGTGFGPFAPWRQWHPGYPLFYGPGYRMPSPAPGGGGQPISPPSPSDVPSTPQPAEPTQPTPSGPEPSKLGTEPTQPTPSGEEPAKPTPPATEPARPAPGAGQSGPQATVQPGYEQSIPPGHPIMYRPPDPLIERIRGLGNAAAPTPQTVAQTRNMGSDTRPTPGFSNYLRQERSTQARELQANPQLRYAIAAMAATENQADPAGPIEALFNRVNATPGLTLSQAISPTFYGPMRDGRMQAMMRRMQQNPALFGRYDQATNAVLSGSNLLAGATDQGSRGDPNAGWSGGRVTRHNEIYNDWGGGRGHAANAQYRREQQRRVQQELQQVQRPAAVSSLADRYGLSWV